MLNTDRMHIRLFLQGVECPISRCSVNSGVTTSAQITLLPTEKLVDIRPGTQVVVGYYDPDGAAPVTGVPQTFYSVLFCGYVRSVVEDRSAVSRGAVLNCEGDMTLLDRFQVYIFSAESDVMSRSAAFVGASKFLYSVGGVSGLGNIVKEAFETSAVVHTPGFENTRGIARSIVGIIERAVGVTKDVTYRSNTSPPTPANVDAQTAALEASAQTSPPVAQPAAPVDHSHGRYAQHEYFALVNAQTHLPYQIGALPLDYSVYKILAGAVSADTVAALGDQMHGVSSLLILIRTLIGRFYHGLFSVATPRAVPTAQSVNAPQIQSIRADLLSNSSSTVLRVFEKVFRAQKVDELQGLTRQLTAAVSGLESDILQIVSDALSDNGKKWFNLCAAAKKPTIARVVYQTLLGVVGPHSGEQGWDGALTPREAVVAEGYVLEIISALAAAQEVATTQQTPPRILTTLILPDLFFSTPPTCNVLFPNQLFSVNLSTPLMDRATRLMLYTDVGNLSAQGEDEQDKTQAVGKAYYAPSNAWFRDSQGTTKLQLPPELPALLPHEVHTGIVPVMSNAAQLDAIFKKPVQLGQATPEDATATMMRVANFRLLDERYKNVTLSTAGPFNPFVCNGLPCAIIDDVPGEVGEPRVYIGLLQSVSHDISSTGATTSYSLTHVRRTTDVDAVFASIAEGFNLPPNVGFEDLCRPFWYDEQYSLSQIGKALYTPLLGCGSVQDSVPPSIEKDAMSINPADTRDQTPTHSTSTAIASAYAPYRRLTAPQERQRYVHSYVRRDVADISDLLGARGLYNWASVPLVVNPAAACPTGFSAAFGSIKAGAHSATDVEDVLKEKLDGAKSYKTSTNKGAFR